MNTINKNLVFESATSRCGSALSNMLDKTTFSTESTFGADKVVVDLDFVVENWVSYMWERSKKGKLDLEDAEITIDWSRVQIDQDDVKFVDGAKKEPVCQALFSTSFTNKTDRDQEYSFKTERKTRQTCTISFEKTFTAEKEKALSFKVPQDIVEIGCGIKTTKSIECGKDTTTEDEITWSVDSLIKVKPEYKVCATLNILEYKLEHYFSVNTYLSGRLIVKVLNRKELNSHLKTLQADVTEIIQTGLERSWLPKNACKFELIDGKNGKKVKVKLLGKCIFSIGTQQHVDLVESKLTSEDLMKMIDD